MIEIKVPATTANLGPGFDSMGAALTLYNTFTVESSNDEKNFHFADEAWFIDPERNLVLQAIQMTADYFNQSINGYEINLVSCEIPVSRGLGSSASAIVAGIYAALYLLGRDMDRELVLHLATQMEGHPDNAVPAVLGGIVAACMDKDKTVYHQIPVHEHLSFLALIPDCPLETALARSVLPKEYSRQDVVYNLSRVAMLTCALTSGNGELLKYCMNDRIHEPYRWSLMPDNDKLLQLKEDSKVLGGFISGAGSTYMLLCKKADEMPLALSVSNSLKYTGNNWRVFPLKVDLIGTQITYIK